MIIAIEDVLCRVQTISYTVSHNLRDSCKADPGAIKDIVIIDK